MTRTARRLALAALFLGAPLSPAVWTPTTIHAQEPVAPKVMVDEAKLRLAAAEMLGKADGVPFKSMTLRLGTFTPEGLKVLPGSPPVIVWTYAPASNALPATPEQLAAVRAFLRNVLGQGLSIPVTESPAIVASIRIEAGRVELIPPPDEASGTRNWGIQPWPGGVAPADQGKPVIYTSPPQLGGYPGYPYPASYRPYPLSGVTMNVIPGLQYGYGQVYGHVYGFPAGYAQHLAYGQLPYPIYPSSYYFTPPFTGFDR